MLSFFVVLYHIFIWFFYSNWVVIVGFQFTLRLEFTKMSNNLSEKPMSGVSYVSVKFEKITNGNL